MKENSKKIRRFPQMEKKYKTLVHFQFLLYLIHLSVTKFHFCRDLSTDNNNKRNSSVEHKFSTLKRKLENL